MSSAELPLVSIIVLYYKRRNTIFETVESVLLQDYSNTELLLVDNHSEDDLKQVITPLGPAIRLIQLAENLGATGGRNAGIRAARGEILVFMDDDMSFSSPGELSKIVNTFEHRPDIQVLAFKICDPKTGELRLREWCHPRYWKEFGDLEFETDWFCEGASAFRREVFDVCGLYYEPLFYGPEGHDLAMRVLDHGFRMHYSPQIRVRHRAAKEGRTSNRQYYFFTRDFVWMAYKDYHFLDGLRFLAPMLLMMIYFTLRSGSYGAFLRGLWHGVIGLRQIRPDRTPISKTTVKYWTKLEKGRPGIRVRLSRHRTTPQL